MSQLLNIAVRPARGAPMQEVSEAQLHCQQGIIGDHRSRPGRRQISVLTAQAWINACQQINQTLPWTVRRANLLVDLSNFSAQDVGRVLCIGKAEIEVCVETEPCYKMDQAFEGLRAALQPDWRGGICGKIIRSGVIRINDPVYWRD